MNRLTLALLVLFSAKLINAETLSSNSASNTHQDVVSTTLSSRQTKTCIVVNKTRERLCYGRAQKFCDEHKGARECRRFMNADVSR